MDKYRKNTSAKVLLPGSLFERILATSDAQFSSCRFQIFNSDPPTGTSYSLKDVLPDIARPLFTYHHYLTRLRGLEVGVCRASDLTCSEQIQSTRLY